MKMSGVPDKYLSALRHGSSMSWHREFAPQLFHQLWYSTSSQAYIQRTDRFDGSVFDRSSGSFIPVIDECIKVLLYVHLRLDCLKVYVGNASELDADLPSIDDERNILLLHNSRSSASILSAFYDKIRNSIAHGTLNCMDDGSHLLIGQFKAKRESPVCFYLRVNSLDLIKSFNDGVSSLAESNVSTVMREAYRSVYSLDDVTNNLFQRSLDGALVYFDNFAFGSVKNGISQEAQLKARVERTINKSILRSKQPIYYILAEGSNSGFRTISEEYEGISIISRSHLAEHLGVNTQLDCGSSLKTKRS